MTKIATVPMALALLVLASCEAPPTARERAESEPDPCAALRRPVGSLLDELTLEEFELYHDVLRRRCLDASCDSFRAAVRAGDAGEVDRAVAALADVTEPSETAVPPLTVPPSCGDASTLGAARDALRRARGASASRPRRWAEMIDALDVVSALPSELQLYVGDVAWIDAAFESCEADAAASFAAAASAARWEEAVAAADLADRCATNVAADRRLPPDVVGAMSETRARASICTRMVDALDAEIAEDVVTALADAQERLPSVPAGMVGAGDRARIDRALAAARREAQRCERQVDLNDRCQERCAIAGEYRSGEWMDQCAEYCDQRAPLCADQRDRWESAGRPRSGVTVEPLAACSASVARTATPMRTGTAPDGARVARRGVTSSDFE